MTRQNTDFQIKTGENAKLNRDHDTITCNNNSNFLEVKYFCTVVYLHIFIVGMFSPPYTVF